MRVSLSLGVTTGEAAGEAWPWVSEGSAWGAAGPLLAEFFAEAISSLTCPLGASCSRSPGRSRMDERHPEDGPDRRVSTRSVTCHMMLSQRALS